MNVSESASDSPVVRYGYAYDTIDLVLNKTQRLYQYWLSKCSAGELPTKESIDLMEVYDVAPYVVVRDIIGDPQNFRVRFWGSGMTSQLGYDPTGKIVSELYSEEGVKELHQIYAAIIAIRNPVQIVGCLEFLADKAPRKYEAIHTPLAAKDGEIVQILSCFDFDGTEKLQPIEPPSRNEGWKLFLNLELP